ncbi:Glycoside hydrolase, family 1 and Glycoside hydrolase, catalytic domain and Glycoside hydrolase, superfamily domain-containing protein [Strongyloides ratti]|uniref:Glycoside hydrolase, family 1 and Glycoside hydrolase, catalytic domain and Glycoside hydrolase, superfamily domain-containing protein n=1 Tax=Strongyloides ratti TaxID=34506 RepID=A0A090N0C1_STRRB|nr:Glycoside hydrolase, family 1 and Glycoside hydrolase, catalytic domain and Glycoside hydrolase, superfamily domain-containing protein [Strongyloides ratti]CEF70427.1 Glycoside hydrolase, family 1 and Glycoside hydrolase, catalytic domain and Glycoside hydrolase, superfamily domain-containing protein [Strongyloides ratti]
MIQRVVIVILLIYFYYVEVCLSFKKNFIWGVTSAAYSIEGGYLADGKGMSNWDYYSNKFMNENGNISCDCYNNLENDLLLIKSLNVTHYKFSISWSRILPQGDSLFINKKGIEYYDKLINGLLNINVEPIVTMVYYDIPLVLEDMGGWMNDKIQDYFYEYAILLFDRYNDKVKYWITIEDPYSMIMNGYGGTIEKWAPGGYEQLGNTSIYNGFYNILKCHGKVGKLYKEKYNNGMIGISFTSFPIFPLTDIDINRSDMIFHLSFGLLGNPIFGKNGNYPNEVLELFQKKTNNEKRSLPRLRLFNIDEIKELRNSSDFIGINYYGTNNKISDINNNDIIKWNNIERVYNQLALEIDSIILKNKSIEDEFNYWNGGLKYTLKYIKKYYKNIPILITGNGIYENKFITKNRYMKEHLEIINDAIENNYNIIGYCFRSLLDGFEWNWGYNQKFGLYEVDFESENKIRKPRNIVSYYRNIIKNNGHIL